jgi:hypothetical protein
VRRAGKQYSGYFALTANTTLTAAHAGGFIQLDGSPVLTLPLAGDFPAGAGITFWSYSAVGAIIQRTGADVIFPPNAISVTSLTLNAGDTLDLISNGGSWIVADGSVALRTQPLAAPTAPLFDADTSIANTQFVQRFGGNFGRIISTPATLTAAETGTFNVCFGPGPFTMPLANSVGWASAVWFQNATDANVTIQRQGTDNLRAGGSSTGAILLAPGRWLALCSDGGSVWYVIGDYGALTVNGDIGAFGDINATGNILTNGYIVAKGSVHGVDIWVEPRPGTGQNFALYDPTGTDLRIWGGGDIVTLTPASAGGNMTVLGTITSRSTDIHRALYGDVI